MAVDPATLHGDQQELFIEIPTDGTSLSNPTLQRKLGWDTDRYFRARDALVDLGLIARGRGRGGVVRRVPAEQSIEDALPPRDESARDAAGLAYPRVRG